MSKINNEAKVRRLTRLVVLGKAKVISYEDLKEVRVKRAAKEKAIAGKGKRGLKRKSPIPEAEAEAEANLLKAVTDSSLPQDEVKRMIETEPAKTFEIPRRAPVARMY